MQLYTAVDMAKSSPGKNIGCLLVDQSVQVSLDLEHVDGEARVKMNGRVEGDMEGWMRSHSGKKEGSLGVKLVVWKS